MFETSTIALSRSALRKNIRFLNSNLPKETLFSSVIKGNAYGHGIGLFLPMVEACGIRHFSVFSAHEAAIAHESRTENSHIMIMGAIRDDELEWAVERDVSFYVFDRARLNAAVKTARKQKKRARIHVELETGLNRTGFSQNRLKTLAAYLQKNRDYLKVDGICTHLAGAENMGNYRRIQQQIAVYNQSVNLLRRNLSARDLENTKNHMACSAAIFNFPSTVLDMARIGIAQYGFWPSKETEIHHFTTSIGIT